MWGSRSDKSTVTTAACNTSLKRERRSFVRASGLCCDVGHRVATFLVAEDIKSERGRDGRRRLFYLVLAIQRCSSPSFVRSAANASRFWKPEWVSASHARIVGLSSFCSTLGGSRQARKEPAKPRPLPQNPQGQK